MGRIRMKILGIDVGLSKKSKTSAYCVLEITSNNIEVRTKPTKFIYIEYKSVFSKEFLQLLDVITIDAPLTLSRISEKPNTGRCIDKLFSGGSFNNSKRGPQPGSISTPKQGWPLYEAGMELKEYFHSQGFEYKLIDKLVQKDRKIIIEVIPKLTQSLLVEREILVDRPKNSQIDNYLFNHTFKVNSNFRCSFEKYMFSEEVEYLIALYSTNTKKYHEELAGLLAALQGVLFSIDNYSIIGFSHAFDGHYLLPNLNYWNTHWKAEYYNRKNKYRNVIEGKKT